MTRYLRAHVGASLALGLALAGAGAGLAADSFTDNLGLTKVQVGASDDTWGDKINANWDEVDGVFAADGSGPPVGLHVGSAKTLLAGGTITATGTLNAFGAVSSFGDSNWLLKDTADASKALKFELAAISPGTTRVWSVPDAASTLVGTDVAQTLSNKALTAPQITGGTITGAAITGGSFSGGADLAVADGGTGASNAATARANLGLVIGTDVQAQDAELAAISGLASAADRLAYFTGAGTAALAPLTATARGLLDDASATAMRATLGVAIGTDVQAQDPLLASIASLSFGAGSYIYGAGTDTAAAGTITAFGRSLVDDADAAAARATMGAVIGANVQGWDADLDAFAGKTAPAGAVVGTSDAQTLSNKSLTAPAISGGTISGGAAAGLTSLGLRSSGAGAFDLRLANAETLTADRTLTVRTANANRTLDMAGDVTFGSSFTAQGLVNLQSGFSTGPHPVALATTGSSSLTLPTAGVLATTAGAETLSNKTIEASSIGATTPGTGSFTSLASTSLTTGAVGAATVTASGAASLGSLSLGTDLAVTDGGTGASSAAAARANLGAAGTGAANSFSQTQTFAVAPVFSDQAGSRAALGLGAAATANTGTSGATVPLLNGNNTHAGANTFSGTTTVTGPFSLGANALYTISAGAITATNSNIVIDTEGAASSDDLDSINGGVDGQIAMVRTFANARDVTLKDGTGNLQLAGDFTMVANTNRIMIVYVAGLATWYELTRSAN